jgi:hypothetical protein
LTLVLLSFGAGVGFSVVSPWGNSGVSATTFKIGTGLYFIVIAMISSAIGGYLAGRLRTKWIGVQTTEVHFRDTAHGFLAWAVASLVGAVLLASPANSLIGGTASGATQAAISSAQTSPMDGYIDTLLRPDSPSAQGQSNPADTRREMVRLFTTSFHNGSDLSATDRTYVAKVVSARTGLSQADADKRVNDVATQVKADLDKARKAAMQIAIWLTLSLFIVAIHRRVFGLAGCDRRRRSSRRDLGKEEGFRQHRVHSLTRKIKEIHHAYSALARRNSDSTHHSYLAVALITWPPRRFVSRRPIGLGERIYGL